MKYCTECASPVVYGMPISDVPEKYRPFGFSCKQCGYSAWVDPSMTGPKQ